MLTEKTFVTENLSLNYAECGPSHGRPLVLLHGATNRWQTWLPVLPLLGWNYHCYAIDQRGHGRSSHVRGGYQSRFFANDVIQFLEQVVKQPAVLIGHSLGAMIAIKVAATAPNLIEAIILGDPPLSAAMDGSVPPPWLRHYFDLISNSDPRDKKLAAFAQLDPEMDPTAVQSQLKSLEMLDPDFLVSGFNSQLFADFDFTNTLSNVSCPTLLIQGNPELGGVILDQDIEQALPLLAHATHIYIPEMGHGFHVPQPNRFSTMVGHFLEGNL